MTDPWVKVAALMPSNRKVRSVSVAARWAYVSAICYSGANLTDGFVPATALPMVDATKKLADELTAQGLWERVDGGWLIHDFLRWNRSRAKVEGLRETLAENGSRGGKSRWQSDSNLPSIGDSNGIANCSLSLSDPVEPLGSSPDGVSETREQRKKPSPSKLLSVSKTVPDDEWVESMRLKYGPQLRDITETLRFHAQGPYYKRVEDKQEFLEKKLIAAVEREATSRNGPASEHVYKPRMSPFVTDGDAPLAPNVRVFTDTEEITPGRAK